MMLSIHRLDAVLELSVMLFQVVGVVSLCLNRLAPGSSWSGWGMRGFVVALVGLGLSGALCGQHDSEFALFAGATMTVLLIGMTIGSGQGYATAPVLARRVAEPAPIGSAC